MSNSYTQFYSEMPLKSRAEADWAEAELTKLEESEEGVGFGYDVSEIKGKFGQPTTWEISFEDDGEGGNIDRIATFVQSYLVKFNPKGKWGMEWAHICNKAIAGEFGGGAFVASAEGIEWINTNTWMQERIGTAQ